MPSLVQSIKSLLRARPILPESLLPTEPRRLVREAFASDRVFRGLEELCRGIGARPNGSKAYDEALVWAQNRMTEAGLRSVHGEACRVPIWRRNEEWAEILTPVACPLPILGLGMSAPTPPGGLTAEVQVVGSFEELESLPETRVAGRIVLLDIPTPSWEAWARMRVLSASAASRRGALGVLVRAFATDRAQPLRTGTVVYEFGLPEIPAAAVSAQDAEALRCLGDGVRVHLRMECRQLPDAPSQNLLGEIPGWERPEEILLLNAHLDSWDVGQGAQDDGVGCLLVMETARLIGRHRPRRTVRVLLSAGGVTGSQGMKAYLEAHRVELPQHLAVLEVDGGAGPARGFLWAPPRGEKSASGRLDLEGLGACLRPLHASTLTEAVWGWDIESISQQGISMLLLDQAQEHYLDILHSSMDSIDGIRDEDLRRNAAILALAAHFLVEARNPVPAE